MSDFTKYSYYIMPQDADDEDFEKSYALGEDNRLYCKVCDKEDGTVYYSRADIREDSETIFAPWKDELPETELWEQYGDYQASDDIATEHFSAESMEDAIEYVTELWQEGSWDEKCLVEVRVERLGWADEVLETESVEIECGDDPKAPDCKDGQEHEWHTPHNVLGGLEENPGVWSAGGTSMVFKSVCKHCGCVKTEFFCGTQRNPGQCDTIEYDSENIDALKWAGK